MHVWPLQSLLEYFSLDQSGGSTHRPTNSKRSSRVKKITNFENTAFGSWVIKCVCILSGILYSMYVRYLMMSWLKKLHISGFQNLKKLSDLSSATGKSTFQHTNQLIMPEYKCHFLNISPWFEIVLPSLPASKNQIMASVVEACEAPAKRMWSIKAHHHSTNYEAAKANLHALLSPDPAAKLSSSSRIFSLMVYRDTMILVKPNHWTFGPSC